MVTGAGVDADRFDAQAFATATGKPEGVVLLAALVYVKALEDWEASTDWDAIRDFVRDAAAAFETVRGRVDPQEARLAALFLRLAGSLDHAMAAENALNCSCPIDLGKHAGRVVRRAKSVLTRVYPISDHPAGEVVAAAAHTDLTYFTALIATAEGVGAYIDGGAAAAGAVRSAADAVRAAEGYASVKGDVYETELRAHRLTLEALAAGWPRIHLPRAKVVYCYPFALRGKPPAEVVKMAADAHRWKVAGHRPLDDRATRLTDMWEGAAPKDRQFGGVSVVLPAPVVTTTARYRLDGYHVEIRLSRLGNHYLRVESLQQGDEKAPGATLHDLHQAMRRATDQMGEEKVTAGSREWTTFPEYGEEVIGDVARVLGATAVMGTPHVVVSVGAAEVEDEEGTKHPAGIADVLGAKGASLFLQPTRQAATALEEWIRYPTPPVAPLNLLGDLGFTDDVVVRTANTTFLMMPGTPNFLVLEYEEMAEFVASLPALVRGWTEDVEDDVRDALDSLRHVDADDQIVLRKRITTTMSELAHLHSPQLCKTFVHREMLDRLYRAAGLERLERDLSAQFEAADGLFGLLATRHEARVQLVIEVAGAVFAVLSLAGLADLANGAFDIGPGWRQVEVGLIALVAAVLPWAIRPWTRGSRDA